MSSRTRGVIVGLLLAAGVLALAFGMATGDGMLIILGIAIAGAANVWRTWSWRPVATGAARDQPAPHDTRGGQMHIERMVLPGVGTNVRMPTQAGKWIGVIRHGDGRRELVIYSRNDPDTVRASLTLAPHEAHQLADALGLHEPTELAIELGEGEPGITVAKVRVPVTSAFVGRGVVETEPADGSARIVAVFRGDQLTSGPSPQFVLGPDDTLVVAGTHQGILALHHDLIEEP